MKPARTSQRAEAGVSGGWCVSTPGDDSRRRADGVCVCVFVCVYVCVWGRV